MPPQTRRSGRPEPLPSAETATLLSSRLRDCRVCRGWSQTVVAERSGIPRSAVSDIERGVRKVDAVELARLAVIFDMPVGYFLGEDLDPVAVGRDEVRAVASVAALLSTTDRHRLLHFARLLQGAAAAGDGTRPRRLAGASQ